MKHFENFHGLIQLDSSFLVVESEDPEAPAIHMVKCSLFPLKISLVDTEYPERLAQANEYEWLVFSGPRVLTQLVSMKIREMVYYGNPALFKTLADLRAELSEMIGDVEIFEKMPFDFLFITKDCRFHYFGNTPNSYAVISPKSNLTWTWSKRWSLGAEKWEPQSYSGAYKYNLQDLLEMLHGGSQHPIRVTQHTQHSRVVHHKPIGGNQDDSLVSAADGTPPASAC